MGMAGEAAATTLFLFRSIGAEEEEETAVAAALFFLAFRFPIGSRYIWTSEKKHFFISVIVVSPPPVPPNVGIF